MRKQLVIAGLLLLPACTSLEAGGDAAQDFKENMYLTAGHVKDWALEPPPARVKNVVPTSYCYHVLQDVLCYRQPMPGWEYRLAGYQGTGAEPPPPAVTQLLPQEVDQATASQTSRVSDMKPVFAEAPPDIKAKVEAAAANASPDAVPQAAQEALPNPLLSPQL